MSETQTTQAQDTQTQTVDLTPTFQTYLRLAGTVCADVVSVAAIYQTFDLWLAIVLSVLIVVITCAAAWYNNSLTKGAIAADYMADFFKDADNAESIKGWWAIFEGATHKVYEAFKADKADKEVKAEE